MKTSHKLDLALLWLAGALLAVNLSAVLLWHAHRSQVNKPGVPDPTVEWWISGDKVTCKHPQTNWPNTDWACPLAK